jgi:DNA-binding transcriptional MerR regulator
MYADAKPDDLIDKFALKLKIKVSTLQYYNKEILIKAKEFLGEYYNFATAREAAVFFKKCGILQ